MDDLVLNDPISIIIHDRRETEKKKSVGVSSDTLYVSAA